MQESFWWWQCSDQSIIYLSAYLHTPFSPSLKSLMVSVDVKHHVYLPLVHVIKVTVLIKSSHKDYVQQVNHYYSWLTPETHYHPVLLPSWPWPPTPVILRIPASLPGLSWHRSGPSVACRITSLTCYTQPPTPNNNTQRMSNPLLKSHLPTGLYTNIKQNI